MSDHGKKGTYNGVFYDDLRAPAIGINPPGAVADPDRDATTGWLLFDATATEVIFVTYQMPHGWIEGSEIRFHVHWHKSTSAAGTVAWAMRYRYTNLGAIWSAYSELETVTVPTISDADTAEQMALTAFTPISVPAGRVSMCLLVELSRVGSGDTYAADAVLTDCDCHIEINQPGSQQLYTKYLDARQYT